MVVFDWYEPKLCYLNFLFEPSIEFVGKIYYVVFDYWDCQAKDDEFGRHAVRMTEEKCVKYFSGKCWTKEIIRETQVWMGRWDYTGP